jgi:hypothetical protein
LEAHSFLAYSPRGAGLASALFHLAVGDNVYGCYKGACSCAFPAAYFALEQFYSTHATISYHSIEGDVYGPWVVDYTPLTTEARCPIPEPLWHELQRLQGVSFRNGFSLPTTRRRPERTASSACRYKR